MAEGTASAREIVARRLGEAMLAAVGLTVRELMGAPNGEDEGEDLIGEAREDGAAESGNFDLSRFYALRAQERETEEAGRAERWEERHEFAEDAAIWEETRQERAADEETMRRGEKPERGMSGSNRARTDSTAQDWTNTELMWLPARESETAREVSDEIERDARRYDGGFFLY